MALVVESTSTVSGSDSDTLTITKPTGVVAGDLLIATGVAYEAFITISGFTTAVSKLQDNSGSVQDAYVTILYRIADSSDVAASNYTVDASGTTSLGGASMYRISGWTSGNPVIYSSTTGSYADAASYAVGASSLSLTRPNNSLMIISVVQQSEENGATYAGYSVTSGESNPTWTEVHEVSGVSTGGGLRTMAYATAYANSTSTTPITAWTLTATSSTAGNPDGYAGILAVLIQPTSPTPDLAHTTSDFDADALTVTQVNVAPDIEMVDAAPTLNGLETTATAPTQWTEQTKESTTWTDKNI